MLAWLRQQVGETLSNPKKLAVTIGAVATVPLIFVAGYFTADWLFFRYFFDGDLKDMNPGEGLFFLYLAAFCSFAFIVLHVAIWPWLDRWVSRPKKHDVPDKV